jgi:hypothetical protein
MIAHRRNASEQFLEPPQGVPEITESTMLDCEAELAWRSFYGHIELVCRNAPGNIQNLGLLAARSYGTALRTAAGDPSGSAWCDFIRAVSTLLTELDWYPSDPGRRWRDARGSLFRIVVENVDLLEMRSMGRQPR